MPDFPRCPTCGYPRPGAECPRCRDIIRDSETGEVVEPGKGFFVSDALHGFFTLPRAAIWVFHRREYVGKLGAPIVASLIIVLSIAVGLFLGFYSLFNGLMEGDWGTWEFLRSGAAWVGISGAVLLTAIAVWLTGPTLIETVIAPFLDPLAAATERAWMGGEVQAVELGIWGSLTYNVRAAAQLLLLGLAVLIPLCLLTLTGIGAPIALLITAWFHAVVWFDIPCSRRGYSLRQRMRLIRRNWARAVGFGAAFQIATFIPLFNFTLLLPASAVATSVLFLHFDKGPDRTTATA